MEKPSKIYDLAIIGGGIAGAGIAREAALRGLQVVLFEKNSFGSGTSSKSSKLIHGGIRYLEIAWDRLKKADLIGFLANFMFVFHSLEEARTLEKIAPGIVKPIPLLMPIYKSSPRKPFAMRFGVYLYYFLARLTGPARLPKIFSTKEEVLKLIPELNSDGLSGAVLFWDRATDDLKLVQSTIESAKQNGAETHEFSLVKRYDWIEKEKFYDLEIIPHGHFYAKKIINASGAWIDLVKNSSEKNLENYVEPIAGCHITLKKFLNQSFLLQAEDKRLFFIIQTGDFSRIGTTERFCATPDQVEATPEEVRYLLNQLRFYFPSKNFTEKDIISRDAGIRPLAKTKESSNPNAISREHKIYKTPLGIYHVAGVKLTDYRRAAEETIKAVFPDLNNASRSKKIPL